MAQSNLRRSARGILAATAVAFVAVLSFAAPASAHNYYVSSTPEAGQVLTSLPDEFIVTTNGNLLELGGMEGGFFMQLTGPDGLYYGDGCVTVSGPSVMMAAAAGPAGEYSLDWQVVSADGHTVSGQIPFTWQPASNTESPSRGFANPPKCGEPAEPQPSETPDVSATETPNSGDDAATGTPTSAEDTANESTTDILWIGGAIAAVAVAVAATLVLIRPKKKPDMD